MTRETEIEKILDICELLAEVCAMIPDNPGVTLLAEVEAKIAAMRLVELTVIARQDLAALDSNQIIKKINDIK